MQTTHTYSEIANSYALWMEYVDPSGLDSEADFDAKSVEEKIAVQEKCFGPEQTSDNE